MNTYRRLVSVVMVCAVLVGPLACSSSEHFDAARAGIQKFRDQAAQSQFEEIYLQSEPEIRNSASQEEFAKLLSAVGTKLGAVQSSAQAGWHINYGTGGTIVTLNYQTTFERGKGTEEFVFRIKDGIAYLVGYHINSNDLVTNSNQTV